MTELVTADTNKNEAAITIQVPPFLGSGTYVVQVPKDQIYRIPPPENALIVERLKKPEESSNRGISRFWCLIVTAVLIVLIGIAIGITVFIVKNKPKNPVFQLRHVGVKNQFHHPLTTNTHPEFRIGLGIENPNANSGISYKQGGLTSLSFKEKKIASGKFPGFDQGEGISKDVVIFLKGSSGAALPKEIKNSISPRTNEKKEKKNNKNHISLSLSMEIPVKMKINSFRTGDAKLVVTCDFEVDTLAKSAQILSQNCKTDRS